MKREAEKLLQTCLRLRREAAAELRARGFPPLADPRYQTLTAYAREHIRTLRAIND